MKSLLFLTWIIRPFREEVLNNVRMATKHRVIKRSAVLTSPSFIYIHILCLTLAKIESHQTSHPTLLNHAPHGSQAAPARSQPKLVLLSLFFLPRLFPSFPQLLGRNCIRIHVPRNRGRWSAILQNACRGISHMLDSFAYLLDSPLSLHIIVYVSLCGSYELGWWIG